MAIGHQVAEIRTTLRAAGLMPLMFLSSAQAYSISAFFRFMKP
jgi:hypothetical protein